MVQINKYVGRGDGVLPKHSRTPSRVEQARRLPLTPHKYAVRRLGATAVIQDGQAQLLKTMSAEPSEQLPVSTSAQPELATEQTTPQQRRFGQFMANAIAYAKGLVTSPEQP